MTITIFHNPKCGTSRNVLQALTDAGHAPKVVEYLKDGWNEAQLADLFGKMGVKPRDILRVKGTPAAELGLTRPDVDDAEILRAMVDHPILVERPIVVTPKGVFLCRPADRLADAL
jgi:arsenate reductase (glutaredoxin)